jgi:hypothetical protein
MKGDMRKAYNEVLCNVYSSPNSIRIITSRRIRQTGSAPRIRKKSVQNIGGKPEEKRSFERPRCG